MSMKPDKFVEYVQWYNNHNVAIKGKTASGIKSETVKGARPDGKAYCCCRGAQAWDWTPCRRKPFPLTGKSMLKKANVILNERRCGVKGTRNGT